MTSIAKPVLLAVIGILAVVLFLQTSNVITGAVGGTESSPASIPSKVTTSNTGPVVSNVACGTWQTTPTACVQDAAATVCTANVHDEDGWVNVSGAGGAMMGWLNTGSGHCASTNEKTCFVNASCLNTSVTNVTDMTVTCTFDPMYWLADNGTWNVYINASDGGATSESSTTKVRNALDAIDVATAEINWGTLSVGGKNQQTDTVVNCGNIEQDIQVNGTTMGCSISGDIGVGNITTGLTAAVPTTLTGTYQLLNTDTAVATVHTTNTSKTTYWNLTVPAGASGGCSGTIWFLAVMNQTTT
jgi:hypothetical protein